MTQLQHVPANSSGLALSSKGSRLNMPQHSILLRFPTRAHNSSDSAASESILLLNDDACRSALKTIGLMKTASITLLTENQLNLLTGDADPRTALAELVDRGVQRIVCVRDDRNMLWQEGAKMRVLRLPVPQVDAAPVDRLGMYLMRQVIATSNWNEALQSLEPSPQVLPKKRLGQQRRSAAVLVAAACSIAVVASVLLALYP